MVLHSQAYFLFKLVRIFDPVTGDRYSAAKKTLTIFSVISLLVRLAEQRSRAERNATDFLNPSLPFSSLS